jgi:hypothetical protein
MNKSPKDEKERKKPAWKSSQRNKIPVLLLKSKCTKQIRDCFFEVIHPTFSKFYKNNLNFSLKHKFIGLVSKTDIRYTTQCSM